MGGKRIKKRKLEVVFDEKKRRDFLTGFRKRKQERRKKARDTLEVQVKEERKRIKLEIKEGFRDQLKKSFEPIPELANELNEEEFETEDVSVTITELSTSELAKSNNWIGQNRPKYLVDQEEEKRKAEEEQQLKAAEEPEEEEIPGMGLYVRRKPKATVADDDETEEATDDGSKPAKKWKLPESVKSKRELDVVVQKDAKRTLNNLRAFQQKQRLDQLRDRKKARRVRASRIKLQEKTAKRKGFVNERKIKRRMKLKRKGKGK